MIAIFVLFIFVIYVAGHTILSIFAAGVKVSCFDLAFDQRVEQFVSNRTSVCAGGLNSTGTWSSDGVARRAQLYAGLSYENDYGYIFFYIVIYLTSTVADRCAPSWFVLFSVLVHFKIFVNVLFGFI